MSVEGKSESRAETIAKYRTSDKDVGSPQVQIALLTQRLGEMTLHVKENPMDLHSQRGMHRVISRRKSLLQYLKDSDFASYKQTIDALGLRK